MFGLKRKQKVRIYRQPLPWLIPMVVMLALLYVYPLYDVVRLSFTDASILRVDFQYSFDSYMRVFTDSTFQQTLITTFIFVFTNVILQVGIGLLIALLLNTSGKRGLPGTVLTRTVVLAAWMIPGVLVGIVWRMILSSANFGILNYMIQSIGFDRIPFLVHPTFALISIIVANVWRGTAFTMILQYAGLQRIPLELYEVAEVDGASVVQKFFYITLPQLRPIMFVNLVLITIYTFNTFDMIMALTGGGPAGTTRVLTLEAYRQVFRFFDMGRGSAVAVVLLLINLCMALVYYKLVIAGHDRES